MIKRTTWAAAAIGALLFLCSLPAAAFAAEPEEAQPAYSLISNRLQELEEGPGAEGPSPLMALSKATDSVLLTVDQAKLQFDQDKEKQKDTASHKSDYTLPVDPALIAAVGTQESTGHGICCPGFACAYSDAVISGTANSHEQYGCGCCVWTGWGGGGSSYRSLGSPQATLREAYDEIVAGRPTVIHVAAAWGEHWITLIGYKGVSDADALSLDNFVALDPWDGAQIVASSKYTLYGDNCEHVSDQR